MALDPKRLENPYGDNLAFYFNTSSDVERGGIVVPSTVGSGTAMEQSENVVEYATDPSGKLPLGMLMQDVEVVDLTKTYVNPYGSVAPDNTKVRISEKGTYTTDMIYPGLTIAANEKASLGPSGLLINDPVNEVNNPYVGNFLSSKDESGFAKVSINLPNQA